MNRRKFIKNMGCGAMSSATMLNTIANLGAIKGAMANTKFLAEENADDYKALVCVVLNGGIDSYNVLIPRGTNTTGDNGFNEYKAIRTDLGLNSANELLALNNPNMVGIRGLNSAYNSFGLHPTMIGMQQLFNTGKMAIMSNIGTLVEPIMHADEYENSTKKIPLGIYSHSDQLMQWQTSVPQSRNAVGFGGRLADLLHATNTNQEISMNISLDGKNLFQRGNELAEYSIRNDISPSNIGFEPLPAWYSSSGYMTQLRDNAVDSLVSATYANLLAQTYSNTTKNAIASFDVFKEALKKVPSFQTAFPNTTLADDLKAIGKVMSVRSELGSKRQIFLVNIGGWDMHDNLLNGLTDQLPIVSQALKAFYDLTVELGIEDKVTTFTISDFARTITSNGQGSDHAWGGNMMVMGGGVNGGKIYGAFPKMSLFNNFQNVSFRGNFIPSIATDELYAELALWFGVSPADLCYVLPNIGNFYTHSAGNYPLGLMNMTAGVSNVDRPQNCLTY